MTADLDQTAAPPSAGERRGAADWQRRLEELLDQVKAPGAVFALMHGSDVIECAAGTANLDTGLRMTADTLFPIASISKVYTATLVMQLVDEGVLDLDTPIRTYLPDFRVADPHVTERLTARHLLTHTGGIDGDKDDVTERGDNAIERYVASCVTLGQVHELGVTFSYCNSGFTILARLVEVLRGKTWDAAVRDHLFAPLGATRSGTLPEDVIWSRLAAGHQTGDDGQPHVFYHWDHDRSVNGAGGVITTAAELLSFARMHLNKGLADGGTRVLTESSAAAMLAPHVELPDPRTGVTHWGLGWELVLGGPRVLAGHGGDLFCHHSRVIICPEAGFAVVLLVNGDGVDFIANRMFREAAAEIGATLPEPVSPPAISPHVDLAALAGTYETIAARITITPAGDHLDATCRLLDERLADMLPESKREQRLKLLPVTSSVFVTRVDEDDDWTSAVFYESNEQRYLHISLRAARATA